MPAIRNARHERFALAIVGGKENGPAYLEAGYKSKPEHARKAASKLRQRDDVSRRIEELLAAREADARATRVEVIQRTAVDRGYIIDKLVEVLERCMQVRPVLDKEGNPIIVETPNGRIAPAYAFSESGANTALRTLAAVTGN